MPFVRRGFLGQIAGSVAEEDVDDGGLHAGMAEQWTTENLRRDSQLDANSKTVLMLITCQGKGRYSCSAWWR